jgi:hypothetical protein
LQRYRVCAVVGVAVLSAVSVRGQGAQQPQVRIETVYPRHVARGQTTVINVAIPSRDAVQAAEISPSTGVTVSGIKGSGSETEQAVGWWEITLDVAKDAAPGDRSLVLVMRMSRSAPTTFSVQTHVPTISDLRIAAPQSNQPTVELRLAATDAAGDLGESLYVWFTAGCGGEPLVGAVRGTMSAGVVRAALPILRTAAMSKYLERNAKITSILSSFSDLVAGLVVQLTNNADQSRTLASIYMHENRLVMAEATVPKAYPPPVIFQQGLGWLDENGTRIRYQLMYYNEPDVPKPPIQGR